MFKRILVPTDGSPLADTAMEVGRKIAEREHARLILLRVEPGHAKLDDVLAATAAIEQQAATLRNMGNAANYRVEFGRPEEGIATVAIEEESELIVMAHHHRGLIEGLRNPSVTAHVLSRSPAPILIWPEHMGAKAADDLLTQPNAAVIVPLDGSPEAERALPLAIQLAQAYDRPLALLRVIVPRMFVDAGTPYALEVEAQVDDERDAREYLAARRHRLAEETKLTVETMLLAGDAASAIVREASAHEGSLTVMSTRGRTGLGKLLLGSVAAKALERTTSPLLIVPPARYATAKAAEAETTEEAPGPEPIGFVPMF